MSARLWVSISVDHMELTLCIHIKGLLDLQPRIYIHAVIISYLRRYETYALASASAL